MSWVTVGAMVCLATTALAARINTRPTSDADQAASPGNRLLIDTTPQQPAEPSSSIVITDFSRELGVIKHHPLMARQAAGGGAQPTKDAAGDNSHASSTKSSEAPTKTDSSSSSSTRTGVFASASASDQPFKNPEPFDGTRLILPEDTTDSCARFMNKLASDPVVRKCSPISLLDKVSFCTMHDPVAETLLTSTQTSTDFFQAKRSLPNLARILDTACHADVNTCDNYFGKLLSNMTADANCSQDLHKAKLNDQNAVLSAYLGLKGYRPMYAATCLIDPDKEQYCYALAVAGGGGASSNTDLFLYPMVYGTKPQLSPAPTCGWCTKSVMAIFHDASSHRSQEVSKVYEGAASAINTVCGNAFVNGSLPAAVSAATGLQPQLLSTATLTATLLLLTTIF